MLVVELYSIVVVRYVTNVRSCG